VALTSTFKSCIGLYHLWSCSCTSLHPMSAKMLDPCWVHAARSTRKLQLVFWSSVVPQGLTKLNMLEELSLAVRGSNAATESSPILKLSVNWSAMHNLRKLAIADANILLGHEIIGLTSSRCLRHVSLIRLVCKTFAAIACITTLFCRLTRHCPSVKLYTDGAPMSAIHCAFAQHAVSDEGQNVPDCLAVKPLAGLKTQLKQICRTIVYVYTLFRYRSFRSLSKH